MTRAATRPRVRIGLKTTDDSTVSLPRIIFGLHLAVFGGALLVFFGHQLEWYEREPVIVGFAVALAVTVFVRPYFVLTSHGLEFAAKILLVISISYASIERDRILGIRVSWDRENVTSGSGGVVHSYQRPYLGIFLEYLGLDPPREVTMCLARLKDKDVDVDKTAAKKRAQEYARALGCSVRRK